MGRNVRIERKKQLFFTFDPHVPTHFYFLRLIPTYLPPRLVEEIKQKKCKSFRIQPIELNFFAFDSKKCYKLFLPTIRTGTDKIALLYAKMHPENA